MPCAYIAPLSVAIEEPIIHQFPLRLSKLTGLAIEADKERGKYHFSKVYYVEN